MTTPSSSFPLPPEVEAVARRLAKQSASLAIEMRDAILASQATYGAIGLVPLDDLTRSCEDHLGYVLSELGGTTRDTRSARAVGRRRAEQGVPLEAMLHAYRVGARFVATRLLDAESASLLRSDLVLVTVQAAWEMLEDYTDAVTTAYLESLNERARRSAETRGAALSALLEGQLGDGAALLDAARVLDLSPTGTFFVVTVLAEGVSGRDLHQRLAAANVVSVWHRSLDSQTGVVAVPGTTGTVLRRLTAHGPERVGVSAAYTGLAGTAVAAREARLAADCAGAGEQVRYDEAPVSVLLARSPDGAGRLVDDVIGPLLALPERERDTLLETLRTWFANEGSVAKTSAVLYVHRNTIGHRAQQIATLTGRSLSDPREAAELYVALEAHRLAELRRG